MFATSRFRLDVPKELIAIHPSPERGASRLMVVERQSGEITDTVFGALGDFLQPHDLMVLNKSRVYASRVALDDGGRKSIEALFIPHQLEEPSTKHVSQWTVLGKGLKLEREYAFGSLRVTPCKRLDDGSMLVDVNAGIGAVTALFDSLGRMPLPPYILKKRCETEWESDRERYQTVFADELGSVAAPTAGLHFTELQLDALRSRGVSIEKLTLHIGRGTFQPIQVDDIREHVMGKEYYTIPSSTLQNIESGREQGGRIVGVGTTVVRSLESAKRFNQSSGWTDLYLYPGQTVDAVDALLTNFHLPASSLLLLVMAFAGEEIIRKAYAHAVNEKYRFYSYGDAMLIV